ncbi:MAG: translational GTPase TypA [bacterium]
MTNDKVRNIAIIAHVDHGKTTLVDGLLKQSHTVKDNGGELIMDSMDQEKERGITITAKNACIVWNGYKINIVDTPGHADFGGEVERGLRMVDGVLLLVDAQEGPMPQTKFVLKKALELGHKAIVVINKIDRPAADPHNALNKTFDLFVELGATERQLDFPVIYASGLTGTASLDLQQPGKDLIPLFETIVKSIPSPQGDENAPLQLLVLNLAYDNYKGQIAIGRITNGKIVVGQGIARLTPDGRIITAKANELLGYEGLSRVNVQSASAGDIVGVVGLEETEIGDTIADINDPKALPPVMVDPPTIQMTFGVNTSPFAGREGKYSTARNLKERLEKELLTNVALKVEFAQNSDQFLVSGRGELHLSVLVETMRREGYELQVGKPQVITRVINGETVEPFEHLYVDVPTDYAGSVMETVGKRKGELRVMTMSPSGVEQHMEFVIPTAGLIGLRSSLLTKTKGTAIVHNLFSGYEPGTPEPDPEPHGSLISMETGSAAGYALESIQERGLMFVHPGDEVYEGMVIGENSRAEDLEVNPTKQKKLTNMRSSNADEAIQLATPKEMFLELAIDYIGSDELVEVTPKSVRIRKRILNSLERKRAGRN